MCTAFVTAMIAVQKHHKTENAARSFFWEAGDGVSQHTPTHSLIATHSIPHPPPTHTLLHPLTRTLPTHTLPHPLTQSLYPPHTHIATPTHSIIVPSPHTHIATPTHSYPPHTHIATPIHSYPPHRAMLSMSSAQGRSGSWLCLLFSSF